MRLYHPELDRVWEGPDDEGLARVMAESGWGKTIPPEHDNPAFAAEQPGATYQLVNPPVDDEDGKPARKPARSKSD